MIIFYLSRRKNEYRQLIFAWIETRNYGEQNVYFIFGYFKINLWRKCKFSSNKGDNFTVFFDNTFRSSNGKVWQR